LGCWMTIGYISVQLVHFFPVLVSCTKKNLETLSSANKFGCAKIWIFFHEWLSTQKIYARQFSRVLWPWKWIALPK
jgi:hypothetical protein